ncbi:MAG: sulfatase-like hydrolase/transferase, partial [Candidatus Omnitrophica bacterium]|nr:sulfatase-like hydrolase/transferase [Candidatus Omnitrophota bacterium]
LKDTHAYLDPTEKQREPYKNLGGALEIYYGAATDADRQIGRILAKLDELGLAENTVVVFSSDNGPEDITITNASHSGVGSPGPFRGRKRSLYEGGVRVPFIVRWPGKVPAGRVDNASVVSGVDLLPTFCALAGVPVPESLRPDGQDVSAALLGRPFERRKPLFWEFRSAVAGHVINRSPMLALREGNWKLLMNPDRSRIELYDIPNETSELNNLADRNPEVVERLAGQLLAWRSELPPGRVDKGAGVNVYPWPKEAH